MNAKKTLLVLSIAAAQTALLPIASAQTTITTAVVGPVFLDGSAAPDLTISASGSISSQGNGIENNIGGTLTGFVQNDGSITADIAGISLLGPVTLTGGISNTGDIDSTFAGIELLFDTVVSGGISNTGNIRSVSNVGIFILENSTINGDISNAGGLIEGIGGIEISGANLNGDIINSGVIRATAEDFAGIDIYSTVSFEDFSLIPASMAGSIINQTGGVIENTTAVLVDGDPTPGLWFDGVNVQGNGVDAAITNQVGATIRSAAGEAIVMDSERNVEGQMLPRTIINGIDNAGSIISVNGAESAISSYGAQITSGILNQATGVISGAQALRITGIRADFSVPPGNPPIENETIFQDNTSGITGGITNNGTLTGTITGAQVSSGTLPLFSTNSFDYGTISITHGASVDSITNTGLIENTGVAPAISLGSNNDLSGLPNDDPNLIISGIPFTTVEPGTVTGDITNSGDIISAASTGIFMNNGAVDGSINNTVGGVIDGADGGIIVFQSTVTGGITNAGQINSLGPEAGGNNAYGLDVQGSTIGAINNSGTISGGFILEDGTMSGDFTNSGDVVAAAAGGDGYVLRGVNSTQGALINSGTIRGEVGIAVEGGAVLSSGIINANGGVITGTSGMAIVVEGSSNSEITTIDNAGTINGQINFGSRGGTFINSGSAGDLLGVSAVTNSGTTGNIQYGPSGGVFSNLGGTTGNVTGVSGNAINGGTGTIGNLSFVSAGGTFDNTGTAGNIINATSVSNFGGSIGDINFLGSGFYFAAKASSGELNGVSLIALGIDPQTQGSSVSTINGDLTFNGQLIVEAGGTENGIATSSQLAVTGNADVRGASIFVSITSGFDLFSDGYAFNVLSTGGTLTSDITSAPGCDTSETAAEPGCLDDALSGIDISDNSSAIEFDVVQRGQILTASIGNIDFAPALPPAIQKTKGGKNVERVADSLNNIALEGDPALQGTKLSGVATQLALLPRETDADEIAYAEALRSLNPDTVEGGALGAMQADTVAASTIDNRMTSLRGYYGFSGAVAGDPMGINGFWVQAYDNETDQSVRDAVDGFDADTFGIGMGFDAPLSERVNAGMAFSYADTDVDMKLEDRNSMSIDSYRLTAYGSYNGDEYYFDGQLAYAMNEYDSVRVVDESLTPGETVIAEGNHDGDQFNIRVRGGLPMAFESGWFITPKAEMNYTYLQEDGYSETGAGNVGLDIDTEDVEVLVFGVGVKAAYPYTTASEVTWIPEISIDYMYDTIGDEVEVDSNFVGVTGAAFITNGANVEKESWKLGLKLRSFSQGNFSFSIGYDYVDKTDYESESISGTLRYDF